MFGKIRIIGGKWKGHQIYVSRKVRPTINLMRETLFNWLCHVVPDAVCLDCFAGSGALGLEALSRGASKVTFLENDFVNVSVLLRTVHSLHAYGKNNEIIYTNSLFWLKKSRKAYNVVFLDPPFTGNLVSKSICLLEKYDYLQEKSWIYIETSKYKSILNNIILPCYWVLYRKKITQSVIYCLYYRDIFMS